MTYGIERRRRILRVRIAFRLKRIRSGRGISQAELARAVGTSPSAICRFEAGEAEPTLTQTILILEKLDCWTVDLIADSTRMPPIRQLDDLEDL